MDNENPQAEQIKSAEESALDNKREALKKFNINDSDIVEKLSVTCGIPISAFRQEELNELRDYVNEEPSRDLTHRSAREMSWKEWNIPETGDTLFVNPDGSLGIKG